MKTFKTRIYPTAKQQAYLEQAFGIRRFCWNWAFNEYFANAKNKIFLSAFDLQKKINNELVGTTDYAWLSEVNSMFRGESLKDFGLSIKAWHKAQAEQRMFGGELKVGPPTPKKKGKCTDSARLYSKSKTEFKVHSSHVFSTVGTKDIGRQFYKVAESIGFLKTADIKACTLSRDAGKYYMSLTYEKSNRKKTAAKGTCGIDLGIKTSVATFDGTNYKTFGLPAQIKYAHKRTDKVNRRFSRTKVGSKRHQRMLNRLQKAHKYERDLRSDFREKLTTQLADSYNLFKIDDFSYEGALNLKHSRRKLADVSPYAFKLRLEQKATERGSKVIYLPKFTPSSKTCSHCGNVKLMTLSDRIYRCPVCGLVLDRDLNSATFAYNF